MNLRYSIRLTVVAFLVLAAQSAHAELINWNVDGTLTNVRTLGNFGSPAAGSAFSVDAVVDSTTPNLSQAPTEDGYFGLFKSFTVTIGSAVLTLDPLTSMTDPSQTNFFGVLRTDTFEQLQLKAALTDGVNEFAVEMLLGFTDPNAFLMHDLTAPLPSLASLFDPYSAIDEFDIYYPVADGSKIFLAAGAVTSLSSSVPEPATMTLFAVGLAALGLRSRKRWRTARSAAA